MTVPISSLADAFSVIEQLREQARAGGLALFLDFDGTLAPIVDQPEDAQLCETMRNTLHALSEIMPLAVVSGRDLDDVRRRVGIDGLFYAGSHGFVIEGPEGFSERHGDSYIIDLDRIEPVIVALAAPFAGVQVERKSHALAIHYRQAGTIVVAELEQGLRSVIDREPRLNLHGGKMVFEIRPDCEWHKGMAVRRMLADLERRQSGLMPVFIGDDLTDEQAFAEIGDDGMSIVVGKDDRPTHATRRLDDVDAVRHFLLRLLERITAGWADAPGR